MKTRGKIEKGRGMTEIIDLDFYRKFRIILPIRLDINQQKILYRDKPHGSGHHTKRFRRKRKVDLEPTVTNKD